VRPSNDAARRLYAKLGFRVVGRRPHYYKDNLEDAILMTREKLAEAVRVRQADAG
jgi:ribosomal-protein-alanine N-acetyltransferase